VTLRARILLSLAPLALLLVALGVCGFALLDRMGGRVEAILRENYASVQAMFRLNEATERIDSSFQFALAGREADAIRQFEANWTRFDEQFEIEAGNITLHPVEDALVARLRTARADYRERGRSFFALPPGSPQRTAAYFGRPGDPGLLDRFHEIKSVADEILRINQENMEQARDEARASARSALIAFGASLAVVALLLVGIGWYLLRTILVPIRAVTDAAHAIGVSAQLDQSVPVFRRDELGRLAAAFNAMTRELRRYRRTNLDHLVRAQRTAQAAIDSFPDPILLVDPGGRADLVNPAAQSLFGVQPQEGVATLAWQPPETLRLPLADALERQRPTPTEQLDNSIAFRIGGEDRNYLPQISPIRDPEGNTLGAAIVLNDATRFRLLDQFKSDLVTTVSHELKTPLTSVRLAIHVLLEETIGPLTPKQTELLVDARESAERLLALIEQLLALARLQQTKGIEAQQAIDLREFLHTTADGVRARAEDKHVELHVECEPDLPRVAVDPERMGQALGNLLNNSITYTPAGGSIQLGAESADGRVVLTVADTGVDIAAEHLPRVFDRFFRIPGQSDETGTGLGLAIVKEIVTAHGGEITCSSEPGKGTAFRITLPAETT
jgi:NtrC-family two-component system sensor histidine kinase KinB